MANQRLLPDVTTLAHWVEDEHLTHQEIAERIYEETGNQVSRSTVSAALSRAGLSKPKARYDYLVPWKVKVEHSRQYPVRMLRTLGRSRKQLELREGEWDRLQSWMDKLIQDDLVVAYDRNAGFVYTKRAEGDPINAPIRPGYVEITG